MKTILSLKKLTSTLTARWKLKRLPGFEDSFLGLRFHNNPTYKFLPHYLYFLKNSKRWDKSDQINRRILAPIPSDFEQAWEVWRQFRSAKNEITSIFLIENYLNGRVFGLEVPRPGNRKSCDIVAHFPFALFIEVKSQSGQQHGDKHPRIDSENTFTPQGEEDLRHGYLKDDRALKREKKLFLNAFKPLRKVLMF